MLPLLTSGWVHTARLFRGSTCLCCPRVIPVQHGHPHQQPVRFLGSLPAYLRNSSADPLGSRPSPLSRSQVLKADNSAVEEMKERMAKLDEERSRIPTSYDLINIACIGYDAMW